MTDRDELADLIKYAYKATDPQTGFPADDAADAILARWRLVPVDEARASGGHIFTMRHADGCTCGYDRNAAQHRAADELTRHDQAAGHYEIELARCSCGKQAIHCADAKTVRTDNHGPHED